VDAGVPFEFDVQTSQDGQPFVLHDRDLNRVVGRPTPPIAEMGAAQVRECRVAATGLPLPTLDEVLELVDGRVPLVVDVRRWGFSANSDFERAVADRLRSYTGDAVLQSFDPFAVFRLRHLLPDRAVGQVSGSLPSAGPMKRALGRLMLTNAVVRPDYLAFELAELPSRAVSLWRSPARPLIAYTVLFPEGEAQAATVADNFFFSGYLPRIYQP
jgi:glycerophosphoryl diester phosphodiesterase